MRLLIANRGEIAVRINRAAKALGWHVIQCHSEADRDSLAVHLADEAVCIGPPSAAKSYLNIAAILEAGAARGAQAVHPGYGFLAENGDFADAVETAGMIFVGPRGETIRLLGDKVSARTVAQAAGVPTVPGSDGRIADLDAARAVLAHTGFPVLIKAAAGGGGRGIRVAHDQDSFDTLFVQAATEAKAAFGDGGLYVEKLVTGGRHVEVQILGDGERFIHCYERECSLQRRRQKVWEEAPAAPLPEALRAELCASAVALARQVGYRGAGTVEYLYDAAAETFYFLEVNTRIQVEHPVTEMVTGIDLVQQMLKIAAGEPLALRQEDVALTGHAIECRINAENPARNFMPFPGTVTRLAVPTGEGVRFDTLLYEGYTVPPFYDSLLGKLIVWGEDRAAALARLRQALAGLELEGLPSTIPLHAALARQGDVVAGRFDTTFLETWLETDAARAALDTPEPETKEIR